MKKILIVDVMGVGANREPIYGKLRQYGLDLWFLLSHPKNLSYYGPQTRVAAENSVTALADAAVAWADSVRFDGVFTYDECGVVATAVIAQRLGLPGNSPDAARNSRNKWKMRLSHQAGGAPCPRFARADTLPDALTAAEAIGYPVILKQSLGAGSQHIYRVDKPEELRAKYPIMRAAMQQYSYGLMEPWDEELGDNTVLVEEYLSGSEHGLDAVIWDGELYIGSIADRRAIELPTFDNDLYATPTRLSPTEIQAVRRAVLLGALGQGLRRGVLHPEVRFHRGQPYILEIAARIGGGELYQMARLSYGYCPVWGGVQVALGRKPDFSELAITGVAAAHLTWLSHQGGVIEKLEVPKTWRSNPNIFDFWLLRKSGEVIRRPPHGNDFLGFIGARGESVDEAVSAAERFISGIHLKLRPATAAEQAQSLTRGTGPGSTETSSTEAGNALRSK